MTKSRGFGIRFFVIFAIFVVWSEAQSFRFNSDFSVSRDDFITWSDLKLPSDNGRTIVVDYKTTGSTGDDGSTVIVVDHNGSGDFLTVQGAIDLVPENNYKRVKIHIRPGVYREKVQIPADKHYITLIGDEHKAKETVITWNDKAGNTTADGHAVGTWNSGSVTVLSDYFCAAWITFENTVVVHGEDGDQAVALRISGERAMFYRVRFLGSQDTLLDDAGTHYFLQCFIQGTTDFIFGNAKSLYKECNISAVDGFAITAHHRDSPGAETGFSFVNCTVSGTGNVYLGRAWGEYSRVIFAYTELDIQVRPEGWTDWGHPSRRKNSLFALYECTGKGAERTSENWSRSLNFTEVMPYLHTTFIRGEEWLKLNDGEEWLKLND